MERSFKRLRTNYLDVVYCHDVEFVTPEEVLEAVTELRRIRDESGTVKYVGISGYPVVVLSELAEMILEKTGEPLDIVMSYANYTVQNTRLSSIALPRLKAAGVDVVANASVLGMGLLRSNGVPVGAQGNWHPSPDDLRAAIDKASAYCDSHGERIEKISLRWGLESWIHEGSSVGSKGDPASGIPWRKEIVEEPGGTKLGVSVIGVSKVEELDETMQVWRSILDGLEDGEKTASASGRGMPAREWSLKRQEDVREMVAGIKKGLGTWVDFAWASPGPDYVSQKPKTTAAHPPLPTPTQGS